MNRRGFLSLLGLGAGALVVPEPVRRYFDLGPSWARHESGLHFHADAFELVMHPIVQFDTPDWVVKEALRVMERNIALAQRMNAAWVTEWRPDRVAVVDRRHGRVVGDVVALRLPARYKLVSERV